MKRVSVCLILGLAECSTGTPPPFPQQLSTADLIALAQQGQTNPVTSIPMSAAVTPPGMPFYYASPPYAPTTKTNTGTQPVLNLQPGIVEGKFTAYVTTEMWTNNFGPIWYDPIYRLVNDDGTGQPLLPPGQSVVPPIKNVGDIYSVAPPDRFYTPYWGLEYVVVPDSDVAKIQASQPKTVRDVLDLGYPVFAGPNGTWSVVPSNLALDPALAPTLPADVPDRADLLPAWMKVIVQSAYKNGNALPATSVLNAPTPQGRVPPWFEGHHIAEVFFGLWDFIDVPVSVVRTTPEFVFVTQDTSGATTPLGVPNVFGHAPLFSGAPVTLSGGPAGGQPNWDVAWELYQVVVPSTAKPFLPMVADPDDPTNTDVFAGLRQQFKEAPPSPALSTLTDDGGNPIPPATLNAYAFRLALNPSCFAESPDGGATLGKTFAQWVNDCQFLDSQQAIEAVIPSDDILDQQIAASCPLLLWATPQ